AHGPFVVADRHVHRQHRQAPLVPRAVVQADGVVVVGQHFAEGGHADGPVAGRAQRILQPGPDPQLGHGPRPALPACPALVAEAAQVAATFATDVAEAWDVEAAGAATRVVLVFVAVDDALGTDLEVVVHDVVAQLAGRGTQPAFPHVGGRVHQHPGRVEARCVEEDDVGRVFVG